MKLISQGDRFRFRMRTMFALVVVFASPLPLIGCVLRGDVSHGRGLTYAISSFATVVGVMNWLSSGELRTGAFAGLFIFSVLLAISWFFL